MKIPRMMNERKSVTVGLRRCAVWVVTVVGFFCPETTKAFNQYVIETVLPRGGQRGTCVDVVLQGNYMDSPRELVSNRGGIRVLSFGEPEAGSKRFMIPSDRPQMLKARLEISPECPLGTHLLFLRTDRFLSDPVLFEVGDLPVVKEVEEKVGSNDERDTAQQVPMGCTVHGEIHGDQKLADRDCYAVNARVGERLSFDLEAVRVAAQHYWGENDCQIRVWGPDGKVHAECDDSSLYMQDPFVSFEASLDGRYVVEVAQHVGAIQANAAHYLLHVGSFPRPEVVYPAGGKPGEEIEMEWINGTVSQRRRVQLPGDLKPEWSGAVVNWIPTDSGGIAQTPIPIRISSHPQELENEPNGDASSAKSVSVPIAVNGIIEKPGDIDCWRFHLKAGEAVDLRVYARSIGTPLDPLVWIRSPDAKTGDVTVEDVTMPERGYVSFAQISRDILDPALTYVAKQDGEYVVGIEDTRGVGGKAYVYRMEIERHRDSAIVYPNRKGPSTYDWTTREAVVQVPRGGSWTMTLALGEGLGTHLSGEEFEFEALGLPPGVHLEAPRVKLKEADRAFPVRFVASPEAQPSLAFVQVLARPVRRDRELESRCQRGWMFSNRRGGLGWKPVWMESLPVAVVEAPCFEIEIARKNLGLVQAGNLEVEVNVARKGGWNGPVQVKFDYLPLGVTQGVPVEVAPGEEKAKLMLVAAPDAPLQKLKLGVCGSSMDGHLLYGTGARLVSSAFADLEVSEPYVVVELERGAVRRGGTDQIRAKLRPLKAFPGGARARLIGLPHGVKQVESVEIRDTDLQCAFPVSAGEEALLGQYKQIQVELEVTDAGGVIRQQTGAGVLRVDPAVSKEE